MKLVIGVTGEIGAGKETFIHYLTELARPRTVVQFSTSAILRELLEKRGYRVTREAMQCLVPELEQAYGKGALARMNGDRITKSDAQICAYDSVRLRADLSMLWTFEYHLLVYVTAPQEVRYERIRTRAERASEECATFEEFQQNELGETEVSISEIAREANATIRNDGSLQFLARQVADFLEQYVDPFFSR